MTTTTGRAFMADVYEAIDFTYDSRSAAHRIAAADRIVQAIDERDTYWLAGIETELTDEQWATLRKAAALTAASHRAES